MSENRIVALKAEMDRLSQLGKKRNKTLTAIQKALGIFIGVAAFAVLIAFFLCSQGKLLTDSVSFASYALYQVNEKVAANQVAAVNGRPVTPSAFLALDGYAAEKVDDVLCSYKTQYFDVDGFTFQADPEDDGLVHYTCTIPGPVNAFYEQLFSTDITNDKKLSPRISMSGELRVETDEAGKRRVRFEGETNPMALKIAVAEMGQRYRKSEYGGQDDSAKSLLLTNIGMAYTQALNQPEFFSETLLPELKAYSEGMDAISGQAPQPHNMGLLWSSLHGFFLPVYALLGAAALALVVILALTVKYSHNLDLNKDAREAYWKEKHEEDRRIADVRERDRAREAAREKRRKERERRRKEAKALWEDIRISRAPQRSKETMLALCEKYDAARKNPHDQETVTAGGWALTALIRCLLLDYGPETREANEEKLTKILDEYNAVVEERNAVVEQLRPFMGRTMFDLSSDERSVYEAARLELDRIDGELAGGLLRRCINGECVPFAYLTGLTASRENTSRFLRQSAVVGLLPWLEAHREDEEAAKALKVIQDGLRQEAASDPQMAFFEVRAPYGCTPEEYAQILGEALHALNPDGEYDHLADLMKRAVREVPGVMELLGVYPLRLIDPQNQQTEGFMEFKPFLHNMWVQYQPPLNQGQVIRRYHEAVDMTVPNAAGINVRLFEDGYTLVPVLLHEFCHFRGDHNEASVWLRTQLFSQGFYKKYPDADPARDYTFVHMQNLLGRKPAPEKAEALGDLIEKLYGKQQSQAAGDKAAEAKIRQINQIVQFSNMSATWCPEVKMPLLGEDESEGEDSYTYGVITGAIKRRVTMPRRIDQREFEKRLGSYMPRAEEEEEEGA